MDPEAHRFLEHWRLQSGFLGHSEGGVESECQGHSTILCPRRTCLFHCLVQKVVKRCRVGQEADAVSLISGGATAGLQQQ